MIPMNMEYLEHCFNRAKELNQNFVAVRIRMDGFPEDEVIINPIINADTKLEYYKKTYDFELNHKHAEGICIVNFSFGMNYADIEADLGYYYRGNENVD